MAIMGITVLMLVMVLMSMLMMLLVMVQGYPSKNIATWMMVMKSR
jgi:hypothetical protein